MNFICGCQMPSIARLEGDKELSSLDGCAYDGEGFLVCVVHHQRRSGWRSLPMEDTPNGRRPIWAFAHYTELEVERYVLFGEKPEIRGLAGVSKPTVPDMRDNSDPEKIGFRILTNEGPSDEDIALSDARDKARHNSGGGRELMAYHQRLANSNAPKLVNGKIAGIPPELRPYPKEDSL
jgi:hypothetical protein